MKNKCIIKHNDKILFSNIPLANTFFSRLIGLLRTKSLAPDQGLLLKKCNQVHTFGMHFSIDVYFLSSDGEILYIEENMLPGKISPIIKNAEYVLEVNAMTNQRLELVPHQQLQIYVQNERCE